MRPQRNLNKKQKVFISLRNLHKILQVSILKHIEQ
jgi:hypothetical protein